MLRAILIFALIPTAWLNAADPTTRPFIPALEVGAPNPPSFIVTGQLSGRLGFQVKSSGQRYRTIFYDMADGTPFWICNEKELFVYDVLRERIVSVPDNPVIITVDWTTDKDPLQINVAFTSPKMSSRKPFFRVDRFIANSGSLRPSEPIDGFLTYTASRAKDKIETLQVDPSNPKRFVFSAGYPDAQRISLDMLAIYSDVPLPDSNLAIPDPTRFPEALKFIRAESNQFDEVKALFEGDTRAMSYRMALAEPQMQKHLGPVDWLKLKEKDKVFGKAYREALAEQGFKIKVYTPPTTLPVPVQSK